MVQHRPTQSIVVNARDSPYDSNGSLSRERKISVQDIRERTLSENGLIKAHKKQRVRMERKALL